MTQTPTAITIVLCLSMVQLMSFFLMMQCIFFFFFSSRRRHTRFDCDWSSDVCSSDLGVGVTDDDAWESYWKVENGIRMSGMPGFKGQLTETQIWQVSVLVKNADKIAESVKKELAAGATTPMEMAMPSGNPAPKKK